MHSLPEGLVCPTPLEELAAALWLLPANPSRSSCRMQCETSVVVSYYTSSNKVLCLSRAFQTMCSAMARQDDLALSWPVSLCSTIHHSGPGSLRWNHRQQWLLLPSLPGLAWPIPNFPSLSCHRSAVKFSLLLHTENNALLWLGCR